MISAHRRRATRSDAFSLRREADRLVKAGRFGEAASAYRQTIAANPRDAAAHNNLGNALNFLGRLEEAVAAHRRAVALRPDYACAYNNLAATLVDAGRLDGALAAYRRGMEIDPDDAVAHSNLIFCLGLVQGTTGAGQLAEARRWNRRHGRAPGPPPPAHGNLPDAGRRLRIGYLSPDFRDHAVSHFVEPLFAAHDRAGFEIVAIGDVARPDRVTERLRRLADRWVSIAGMTEAEAAHEIRANEVDILVDLAGHGSGRCLSILARRPAPIQAAWLGYCGTTGLDAIDYRITDEVADPTGVAEGWHSETLVRLAGGGLCYAPPADAPAPGPAPANGSVTFASFNNLAKVTPEAVAVWARILHRVPDSRLLLKGRPFGGDGLARSWLASFARHGIDPGRIEPVGQLAARRDHLARLGRADVALDSFPYNGVTTTLETLWMGVPVITLAGGRSAARMGASILHHVGAPELIADSETAYVEKAVALAADGARRAGLRRRLRHAMATSSLCDAPSFARNLEAVYRGMWRHWCAAGLRAAS